jgi:quercetin dioxygenase-like cupin family protein
MATQETMTQFDLNAEIERFPPDVPSGRRSETLIKSPRLRVVLITMRAGTELHEHVAPGTITVQPIRGRFAFAVGDDEREIEAGTLISVEGGVRHAVRALEDGAFLLTIGWSGEVAPGDKS